MPTALLLSTRGQHSGHRVSTRHAPHARIVWSAVLTRCGCPDSPEQSDLRDTGSIRGAPSRHPRAVSPLDSTITRV